ncbi:MAG: translation initiation factor IF-2 [Candidatus Aenigmatarchaeota archaeon]
MKIRAPIVITCGHVDAGKTTLLDKIRGTAVTKMEPGELTQYISCSFIPLNTIKKLCGRLIEKLKVEIEIPGILLIDTPGHASFLSLRKRGGSASDIAILVVDINEGFQEQTDESLSVLKEFKIPFVVAATKIDKIQGWQSYANSCFLESFEKQTESSKNELEKKIYRIASQLYERGFDSERFDRVEDFRKKVVIVPVSGISGEGIPELLMVLAGIAQQFLKERLILSNFTRGIVLEVKETVGFGITIDVILYDGSLKRGDYIVIGGKEPVITKIRALLLPRALQDIRVEKQFESVEEVFAAAGIKIAAPKLNEVIAGSPLIGVKNEDGIEEAKIMVQKEVEEIEFNKQIDGIVLKADTLGSLEAMIKLLKEEEIPIRKAEVGNVTKEDIIELQNVKEEINKVVLAFNVKASEEVKNLAKDLKIEIFQNNVVYRLIEDYKQWCLKKKERKIEEKLEKVIRPVKIKLLEGFVFRASNPAIFGVEVLAGLLKPGALMKREDGKIVGRVKEIQKEGKTIKEAKIGERVAISMEEPTIGRTINEGDVLTSALSEEDIKILREVWDRLSEDEREIININF